MTIYFFVFGYLRLLQADPEGHVIQCKLQASFWQPVEVSRLPRKVECFKFSVYLTQDRVHPIWGFLTDEPHL